MCVAVKDVSLFLEKRLFIFGVKLDKASDRGEIGPRFFAVFRCFVRSLSKGMSLESRRSRAPHFGAEHPSVFGIAQLDRIKNSRDICSPSTTNQRAKGT